MVFILPLTISNKQSDLFAKNLLWVANIINLFEFIWFLRRSKIPFAVFRSKLPVGSSAKIIWGLFIKALAIEIRCFSPPESCDGKWLIRLVNPTFLNNDLAL